jgi:hypothetical protein
MRIGVTGLLAVVTLVAAACGGSAAQPPPTSSLASGPVSSATATPAVSPTSPATSGPNVRPGERPPAMPAAAKQHTQEGALAFAGYFYQVFDFSLRTMTTKALRSLSSNTCGSCQTHIKSIDDLGAERGHVQGGRIILRSIKRVTGTADVKADVTFLVRVDQEALVEIHANGSSGGATELKRRPTICSCLGEAARGARLRFRSHEIETSPARHGSSICHCCHLRR